VSTTHLLQAIVGQVESSHTGKVVDIRRQLGEAVAWYIYCMYAVLFLRLGCRKFLQTVVRDIQLYRRSVEVLLYAAYVVLRDVNLDHTQRRQSQTARCLSVEIAILFFGSHWWLHAFFHIVFRILVVGRMYTSEKITSQQNTWKQAVLQCTANLAPCSVLPTFASLSTFAMCHYLILICFVPVILILSRFGPKSIVMMFEPLPMYYESFIAFSHFLLA